MELKVTCRNCHVLESCLERALSTFTLGLKPLTLYSSDSLQHKQAKRSVSFFNSGWFWGDPHIKTLDGGNYTFNGLGEYTMVDAENGTFNLQARTKLAQGNSTTATIFSAGAAKEKNSSTIEVRVKDGGENGMKSLSCRKTKTS